MTSTLNGQLLKLKTSIFIWRVPARNYVGDSKLDYFLGNDGREKNMYTEKMRKDAIGVGVPMRPRAVRPCAQPLDGCGPVESDVEPAR